MTPAERKALRGLAQALKGSTNGWVVRAATDLFDVLAPAAQAPIAVPGPTLEEQYIEDRMSARNYHPETFEEWTKKHNANLAERAAPAGLGEPCPACGAPRNWVELSVKISRLLSEPFILAASPAPAEAVARAPSRPRRSSDDITVHHDMDDWCAHGRKHPLSTRCQARTAPAAPPTHRCKICRALWRLHPAERPGAAAMWQLCSAACGPCCDNVRMADQIEPICAVEGCGGVRAAGEERCLFHGGKPEPERCRRHGVTLAPGEICTTDEVGRAVHRPAEKEGA
jgi:hypothetical protein